MRALVIEDDPSIAGFLKKGLREAGFAVDVAANGVTGEQLARNEYYDIILLDLMLPQKSGLSVLTGLRERGQQTPVICLTAKDTVHDRIAGLDAGADDYLVKPFSVAELLARIRAVLRRGTSSGKTVLRIADLKIDPAGRIVERGGRRIDLSPKEYAVLEYLARNEGHILTRTMILQHVWDCRYDPQTNVVDVHINRLRRKIDDGYPNPLINTVRGAGYVLRESLD
jgi:two-component system OmpR family response regulator